MTAKAQRTLLSLLLLGACVGSFAQSNSGNVNATTVEAIQYVDSNLKRGGTDIGSEINRAYAACPKTGCHIKIAAGSYRYTTPILLNTANKPAILEGEAGDQVTYSGYPPSPGTTQLYYTPTSGTALTMSTCGGTGTGVHSLVLYGPGFSETNAATGLRIVCASRQVYRDLLISGFKTGLEIGSNSYLLTFYNLNTQDDVKALYIPSTDSETGETITFIGGLFSNKSPYLPGHNGRVPFYPDCIDLEHAAEDISFHALSIDQCGVYINNPTGQSVAHYSFESVHFENPNGPATSDGSNQGRTIEDFVTLGTSCGCVVEFGPGSDILESNPTTGRTELVINKGPTGVINSVGTHYQSHEAAAYVFNSSNAGGVLSVITPMAYNVAGWFTGTWAATVVIDPWDRALQLGGSMRLGLASMPYGATAGLKANPGSEVYCNNCKPANPSNCSTNAPASCLCANNGRGMIAKYENFVGNGLNWYCH